MSPLPLPPPDPLLVLLKSFTSFHSKLAMTTEVCCDFGQIDIFSRIELFPAIVLSSDNAIYKNDIQWFMCLFDEFESMEITINTYRCW